MHMVLNESSHRPPLPDLSRTINHTSKQHKQNTVDWEHALQHFAVIISDELNDLHTRFLHENDVTFIAWKRLWKEAKMSTTFLVEFWESTPTKIHKTILQQTLDGLVLCIEEHGGDFVNAVDIAALIGRVFAMYCAYSVQVGSPKHKIDVDPQAGSALLTINCVMTGTGARLFPRAAREVRAMMHRLVGQENAFLRCLQGFGPTVRVKKHTLRSGIVARHELSVVADNALEGNAPIYKSKLEQLKTLNDRYQELMSRARAGPSVSGAGAKLGLRRAKPVASAPLLSASVHQETRNNGQDLARALTLYMEFKTNEEVRKYDRVARAAAACENDSRTFLELSDNSSNILDLSDRGSAMSGPPNLIAASVTSSRRRSNTRHKGGDSDAVLVELESNLCADISSDHVAPTRAQSLAKGSNEKSFSTVSEISEADSDALADLERELAQSVDVVKPQVRENAIPKQTLSRARGKLDRKTGIVTRQGARATASTVIPTCTKSTRSTATRVRSKSVASRLSFADSSAVSSSGDNDELAAIQAELDVFPSLSGPRMDQCVSHGIEKQQSSIKMRNSTGRLPAATPKAKQAARQALDRASRRSTRPNQHDQLFTSPSRSRAVSIASDSSELIAHLQAELDLSAEPTTRSRTSIAVVQANKPRRSSRLSSMASETESNIVEELERKSIATGNPLGTVSLSLVPAPAKTIRKRAAQHTYTTRSIAKKIRLNDDVTAPSVTAVRQLPVTQASSKAKGEQRVFGPTAHPESSRISSVPSDTESDELAELVKELDIPATVQTSTRARRSRKSSVKRSNTRSIAQNQSPASSNVRVSRSGKTRSVASVMPDTVGLRHSTRLSSQGSDTESDGLGDLMAELESDSLVVNTKNSKKPRARVATTRKPPKRVQMVRSSRNQAKEVLTAARAPHAARQPEKVAAKPFTRQPSASLVNMRSSRRSTRSSSAALDSESDGLAELEAELQARHT
ncbi:unnamed protein product [Peronospora farinosa]|uniref:Uncharacterized protein n=1 Tax=Peronospora farinosa TaxID=134698 RepID=A0AAV0SU67_9STRA|nr:unnamed protein product [Peronospora farinosa]CAI5705379.1 unnamed protein product [Peronospora farinosa]